MNFLTTCGEPLFLTMLVFAGLSGLLAVASPHTFGTLAQYGSRVVAVSSKTEANIERRWIDIDRYVLQHARFFGFLVTGSVVYLWLLSQYGSEMSSKPFSLVVVAVSLMMGIIALAEITKQRRQIAVHLNEAHTDPLTGLANRRSFDLEVSRRITQRQRQGTPLCLMILDIDQFKSFNDQHGHEVGDAILMQLAETLTQCVQARGVVSRFGGDEFTLCLGGSSIAEASLTAERIRKKVSEQLFQIDKLELQLTISIGLAEARDDDDGASMLRRADSALYAAKEAGRNQSFREGHPEPAVPTPCT